MTTDISTTRSDGDERDGTMRPALFRAVMRHHAKGVAVITAGDDAPVGLCATSLASVALEPPHVSFAVGLHTASWATMARAPCVIVNLLAEGQEDVARRFARPGARKFGPATSWHRGPSGSPYSTACSRLWWSRRSASRRSRTTRSSSAAYSTPAPG